MFVLYINARTDKFCTVLLHQSNGKYKLNHSELKLYSREI